jgi:hypothetical protein
MPSLQLPVAVTLASCALLSLAVRGLSASKRGKIVLPVTLNDPLEPERDPFDVTSPEDIIDGEPVDEASFWLHVRSFIQTPAPAYSVLLFFLRRSFAGHFWSLLLSLLRLYKLSPWVMPLRFRPQRPQPHTCSMCCLPFISRFSRFSAWAKTRFLRISGTLFASPSLQRSRLRCWELPRFSLVIRHPFRHQLRTVGLAFCK